MSQSSDELLHFLTACGLSDDAANTTLLEWADALARAGRTAFLQRLALAGVTKLSDRQKFANELGRATREGRLACEGMLAPDFQVRAERMPSLVRELLVDGRNPTTVAPDKLLRCLGLPVRPGVAEQRYPELRSLSLLPRAAPPERSGPEVLRARALSAAACAALRTVVDAERRTTKDSIDGGAEHQRNVDRAELVRLIGEREVEALWALPHAFLRRRGGVDATAAASERPLAEGYMFIRRYSADTRPWIPFHADRAAVTVNVSLTEAGVGRDCEFPGDGGGALLGLYNGGLQVISREEGDATVHASTLLHAVTRIKAGARYSLILFFGEESEPPGAPPPRSEATTASDLTT
jgi:hypothetical protein